MLVQNLRVAWGPCRLTPPSSGRPKGRFAPFAPPLMSNVRFREVRIPNWQSAGSSRFSQTNSKRARLSVRSRLVGTAVEVKGGPVRPARWGCLSVNRRGRPSCGGLLTFRLRPKAPRRRSGRAARPLAVSSPVGFACKPQDTLLWPRRYSYFEPTGLFAVFWCSTLARDGAVHQQRNARQVHLKRRPASRLPCAAT